MLLCDFWLAPFVRRLPFGPRFVGLSAIFPVAVCPRQYFRGENRSRHEEKESFVCNRSIGSPRLLLGVLEHIYILGDSLNFEVVALHFVVQRHKAKGVMTHAYLLKVRK